MKRLFFLAVLLLVSGFSLASTPTPTSTMTPSAPVVQQFAAGPEPYDKVLGSKYPVVQALDGYGHLFSFWALAFGLTNPETSVAGTVGIPSGTTDAQIMSVIFNPRGTLWLTTITPSVHTYFSVEQDTAVTVANVGWMTILGGGSGYRNDIKLYREDAFYGTMNLKYYTDGSAATFYYKNLY